MSKAKLPYAIDQKLQEDAVRLKKEDFRNLFQNSDRAEEFSIKWQDFFLDFSKNHIDKTSWDNLQELLTESNFHTIKKSLFDGDEINWIKSGNSFLGFENIVDEKIFNVNFIKLQDKEVIYSVKSDVATISNNKIIFDKESTYKSFIDNVDKKDIEFFEIPIQSKITFSNIKHLGLFELNFYRQIFDGSTIKKDILFKSHIDKSFYNKIFLPISSLILILFFGSFIFTSLRDSTIGNRVVVSVVGAFIYQLIQDLSSGIFISYGLTTILGIILPSVLLIVASMISFKKI